MYLFHKALLGKIYSILKDQKTVETRDYYFSFPTPDLVLAYHPEKFDFQPEGKTTEETAFAFNNQEEIAHLVNSIPTSKPFFNLNYSGNALHLEENYTTILENVEVRDDLVETTFYQQIQEWKNNLRLAKQSSLKNLGDYLPCAFVPESFWHSGEMLFRIRLLVERWAHYLLLFLQGMVPFLLVTIL